MLHFWSAAVLSLILSSIIQKHMNIDFPCVSISLSFYLLVYLCAYVSAYLSIHVYISYGSLFTQRDLQQGPRAVQKRQPAMTWLIKTNSVSDNLISNVRKTTERKYTDFLQPACTWSFRSLSGWFNVRSASTDALFDMPECSNVGKKLCLVIMTIGNLISKGSTK